MVTINFPSSPSIGQTYSFSDKTWTFNGDGWVLTSTSTTIRIDAAFDAANTANVNANLALELSIAANNRSACNEISIDFLENSIDIISAFGVSTSNTANAAYNHANAAFDTANLADPIFIQYVADLANTANDTATWAANTANTANAEVFLARFYACTAITYADTINQHLNVAYKHANSGYDQANTATILAQAAFDTANSGGGATTDSWARDAANAASSYANSSFTTANSAETLAQASFDYANTIVTDTKLTVASVDESNVFSNIVTNVTTLGFDTFTGFHVTDLGSGNVKISLGSTFSVWNVPGQDDLTAVGDDTIRILSANGISISTNNSSDPKEISFDGSSIFKHANAAFDAANNAIDTWVRDAANSASSYANSAFTKANLNFSAVTSSYIQANAAFEAANAAYALAESGGGGGASGIFDYGLISEETSYTAYDYGTL